MTYIDWITVSIWVVGTSAFGLYFKRYVKSTRDYLLAGRRLRWWQIAMAQSADAVDATDFVAVTGKGCSAGVSQIGFAWWGMGIGSILLSRYIAPLLYRTGVYTNAEYLELRFTPSLRIASAVLQAFYRFVAMAIPWFKSMIDFYVALTGTFFLPLIVPYVGGALYRKASRGSGIASLVGGIGVGSFLFLGNEFEWFPAVLGHPQWRPFWVLAFTSMVFVLWSILENRRRGPLPQSELAGVLNAFDLGRQADSEEVKEMIEGSPIAPWEGKENVDFRTLGISKNVPWYSHPTTYEILAVILLVGLMVWWW